MSSQSHQNITKTCKRIEKYKFKAEIIEILGNGEENIEVVLPLVVPARVLVGEGVLTKLCRKKPKPRQFFLFNDILVYGNIVINKKKYNKQHVIPLEEVKLLSLEDDGSKAGIFQIMNRQVENLAKIFVKIANMGLKNGWQIISSRKSFAVYAATATEKAEWMAHINKCIQDLFAKTGKKASDNHAAVWVPDSEASTCMHCMKTKFTALNRRHHCRKCGAVVCGGCSPKKAMLPAQSSKPLRVCSTCYDASNKGKVPQDIKKTDGNEQHSQVLEGWGEQHPGRPKIPKMMTILLEKRIVMKKRLALKVALSIKNPQRQHFINKMPQVNNNNNIPWTKGIEDGHKAKIKWQNVVTII
ncbi:hypothetical protein QZH41_011844 [Actinostola sp. cb2023]|nr:hypothetical protein QZH41_011844 [Actinostola sp. cb2023]